MNGVDYDVIVVGAGTAGCFLAKQLTRAGLDVRVLDNNKRTKTDSGIVSSHFFDFVPDRSLISSRIKAMDLVSPNGTKINVRSRSPFAYLLDREKLGKKVRTGVKSKIVSERFLGCEIHKGWVDVKTDQGRMSASVLVGADGAMSGVRKALGIAPPNMTFGVINKTNSSRFSGVRHITVYFNKNYSSDGFAWRIPKNGEIGLLSGERPLERLRTFSADMDVTVKRPFGAPIPIGTCKSYSDRALLVGDAAGQVKPLTGGGIVWGLRCADVAARAIEQAFDVKRFDAFFWKTEYERRWHDAIGKELRKQMFVRDLYGKLSNARVDKIFELAKPRLEAMHEFDYDSLSSVYKAMSKFSVVKMLVSMISSRNAAF